MAQNLRNEVVNSLILNDMIVIEGQDVGVFDVVQVVDQGAGENRLAGQGDGSHQRRGFLQRSWEATLDSRNDILDEHAQVVVTFVERNPDRRPVHQLQPCAEQCGFAIAGRAGDKHQRHISPGIQITQQALARIVIR